MKLVSELSYQQWQKRNSLAFNKLSKSRQKEIRKKGYFNRGWNQVKKSWHILRESNQKVVTIFDRKLAKGDLKGAINIAIMDSDNTSVTAQKAINNLEKNQQKLDKLATEILTKYQPL